MAEFRDHLRFCDFSPADQLLRVRCREAERARNSNGIESGIISLQIVLERGGVESVLGI